MTSFKVVAAFTAACQAAPASSGTMKKLGVLMAQCSLVSQENSAMVLLLQIVPAWSYIWDLLKISCAALQADYIDLHGSQGISVLSPCNHLFTSGPIKAVDIAVTVTRFELGLPGYVICLRRPTPTPNKVFLLQSNETGK